METRKTLLAMEILISMVMMEEIKVLMIQLTWICRSLKETSIQTVISRGWASIRVTKTISKDRVGEIAIETREMGRMVEDTDE